MRPSKAGSNDAMTGINALIERSLWIDHRVLYAYLIFLPLIVSAVILADERFRKRLLLVAGLTFLAWAISPLAAMVLALYAYGLRRLAAALSRASLPSMIAICLAQVLVLGAAVYFLSPIHYPMRRIAVADVFKAFFLSSLLLKAIYYLYEMRYERAPSGTGEDLLLYFFAPPYLIGSFVIVSYTDMLESRTDPKRSLASGLGAAGLALLHWTAAILLTRYCGGLQIKASGVMRIADVSSPRLWLGLFSAYLTFYCIMYGYSQLCIGAARMLGYDLADDFDPRALLAVDYLDKFRKVSIHFRRMIMSLFYYPLMIRLSRAQSSPGPAQIALAFLATFMGRALLVLFLRLMLVPPAADPVFYNLILFMIAYDSINYLLVFGSFLFRSRVHFTASSRTAAFAGALAGIFITLNVRALAHLFLGRSDLTVRQTVVVLANLFGLRGRV